MGFQDTDANVTLAKFEVVTATEFSAFSFDPKVKGKTEGSFDFFIFSKIAQRVTLQVTLQDEAGNTSFPKEFTFDALSLIEFLTQWGNLGSGNGQFRDIGGIALDRQGNVYVTDFENHRVQKFSSDGTLVATWGGHGSSPGRFDGPLGIAIDSQGNVYVAEAGNRRIQKFTS